MMSLVTLQFRCLGMAYQINHHVPHIRQSNRHDCWAAALAMIMGRHSNAGTEHVKQLCREHGILPNSNGRLPPENVPGACRAVGLHCHDLRGRSFPTVDEMAGLMRLSAIAAFGQVTYEEGAEDHVLVFYSLSGDGNQFGTDLRILDPYTGTSVIHAYSIVQNRIATRLDFLVNRWH